MNCVNHPDIQATGACVHCGNMFCSDCLVTIKGRKYCKDHVDEAVNNAAQANPVNVNISNVNTATASASSGLAYIHKSKMVALLLCIFLGPIGAHRFYVGKSGSGIIYLLTLGLFGIGWIWDLIMIIIGTFKDKAGQPLV